MRLIWKLFPGIFSILAFSWNLTIIHMKQEPGNRQNRDKSPKSAQNREKRS
jgi:hypothetical protein